MIVKININISILRIVIASCLIFTNSAVQAEL